MCRENSNCTDAENGNGYQCHCLKGFQGNPYLQNGCQDIDECVILQPCVGICTNLPGTYNCSCPKGSRGDGKKDGNGCTPTKRFRSMDIVLVSVSISFLLVLLGVSWLYWGLREKKISRRREKFFLENGGRLMLQKILSEHEGSIESARIFTDEELKKATDHYHESRILGQGGHGTVYRGILADNMVVAIKKAKILDRSQVEEFINELIILSQINHRNVVKLIGCCFETEVPLLVYEFVTNGTLSDHIHKCGHESTLSWRARLHIAGETAGALSYLHSDASAQILHRDIKSTNILLDENYTAKVADFGASRLVPLDGTQLTTLVQGTLGYLDPEYLCSSQLTEKSDVYSFGVVLAELLTGLRALSFERAENERNLSLYFASAIKGERLFEIINPMVLNEGNPEEIMEVAMLANQCLTVKGEDRPTMKEVAMELEGLMRVMDRHPWLNRSSDLEEAEDLLGERSSECDGILRSNASGNDDSIRNQVSFEIESGR
ncbi:wall-associated receptor kinase 2 [Eucalyptus grandis]|uniref:wall-associated receptor kinase 2 n=1 Tax=Eucalyptus grandis TaxID=71139 RepID=UPI00192E7798|nr:wall-associated receptor kinase 2 [Eucalyptus grandis]